MDIPEPPEKFNWRELKQWLNTLREANLTNRAISGKNIHVSETPGNGTTIDADDCSPCP